MPNRWGNNGSSDRLIILGSKITADGDFSHEIKRCLLLERKAMTNIDSILKSRDITLPINRWLWLGTKNNSFMWTEVQGKFSSVHFSRTVMPDSLWPHGLQHARIPCPSPTPGACSNSRPSSRWCHPTISSSVILFSFCFQSFPASKSFPKR